MTDAQLMMRIDDDDYDEFRDPLKALCEGFPGAYWRALEDKPADQRYPAEFVDALMDSGFLGALIPEEFDGAGLSLRIASVILETIHSTSCNAGAAIGQMYLSDILVRHGSDAQKQKYLPGIAAGQVRFLASAISEIETGSDHVQMATTAEKRGDVFVVNGSKEWANCTLHSDLLLLLARTSPATSDNPTDGLTAFLVDMKTALKGGLSGQPIDAMNNDGATNLVFDGLELPLDAVIGEVGKGYDYYRDLAQIECILYAACASGDSAFFSERAVNYAKERVVFGRPIAYNQGIQFPISKAYIEVQGAKLIGNKAAAVYDAGQMPGPLASMAKHMACEAAWLMADACFTTHGGFAFAREYDIERKWRDARVMQLTPQGTTALLSDIAVNDLGMPSAF